MPILGALYKGTTCPVGVDGELTDWFTTVIGILQGCLLTPLLFNILMEVVAELALVNHKLWIKIPGIQIVSTFRRRYQVDL